jgi:hypothetical protein
MKPIQHLTGGSPHRDVGRPRGAGSLAPVAGDEAADDEAQQGARGRGDLWGGIRGEQGEARCGGGEKNSKQRSGDARRGRKESSVRWT